MQTQLLNILQTPNQSIETTGKANPQIEGEGSNEFLQLLNQAEDQSVDGEAQNALGLDSEEQVVLALNGNGKKLTSNKNEADLITKSHKEVSTLSGNNEKEILIQKFSQNGEQVNPELLKGKTTLSSPLMAEFNHLKTSNLQKNTNQLQSNPSLSSGDDFLKNMSIANKENVISTENGQAKQTQVAHFNSYKKGQDLFNQTMIKNPVNFSFESTQESAESQSKPQLEIVQNEQTSFAWSQSEGGETESGGFKSSQSTQMIDLSSIKVENKTALIGKITQYIEQAKLQNTDSLDVLVKHDELGQFRVVVNKAPAHSGQNLLDLQIQAVSDKGHQFFVDNEVEIVKKLSDVGVKLADIKILKGSEINLAADSGSKNFEGRQSFDGSNAGSQDFKQHQKGSNDRESSRRQEMWDYYREQASA